MEDKAARGSELSYESLLLGFAMVGSVGTSVETGWRMRGVEASSGRRAAFTAKARGGERLLIGERLEFPVLALSRAWGRN